MAFAHTSGEAASILDFYSILETWLVSTVGWTLESGAGTDDLVFSSDGEDADKTMLFIRLWRDNVGTYPQRFYARVQNDAAGTQNTGSAEYMTVLSDGSVPFRYWATANKDAVVLVVKYTYFTNTLYFGLLKLAPLSAPDETYYMACNASAPSGPSWRILRGGDGSWNVSRTYYANAKSLSFDIDPWNNSLPIAGAMVGTGYDITGQVYFMSAPISEVQVHQEYTFATEIATATSTWILLSSSSTLRFALQTSDISTLPIGIVPEGTYYAAARYQINDIDHFFIKLRAFLGQVGWSETDLSGTSGYANDWVFSSIGESGTDTVYVRVYRINTSVGTNVYFTAQTDATTSPANAITFGDSLLDSYQVPTLCYFFADRDLFGFFPLIGSFWTINIVGLVIPALDDLPDSNYYTFLIETQSGSTYPPDARCLRSHDGDWNQSLNSQLNISDATTNSVTDPNSVDGVTNFLWPEYLYETFNIPYGRVKYIYHRNAPQSSTGDTLSDPGGNDYTILYNVSTGNPAYFLFFAIRTNPGLFSSSSCSSSLSSCSSSSCSSSFSSSSSSFSSSSSSFSSSSSSFSSSSSSTA